MTGHPENTVEDANFARTEAALNPGSAAATQTGGVPPQRPADVQIKAAQKPNPRHLMLYPTSALTAIQDGCVLDQRVRFAQQFLLAAAQGGRLGLDVAVDARHVLDLADAVYEEGERRGWITPLPPHANLSRTDTAHVERSALAQVHGSLVGQRLMQEAQPPAPPAEGLSVNGYGQRRQ